MERGPRGAPRDQLVLVVAADRAHVGHAGRESLGFKLALEVILVARLGVRAARQHDGQPCLAGHVGWPGADPSPRVAADEQEVAASSRTRNARATGRGG